MLAAAFMVAALGGVGPVQGAAPAATVPTAEDFGALPFLRIPMLAPDGNRLAARSQVDGKPRLILFDLTTDKHYAIALPEGNDLAWYRWAGDNTLLVSLSVSGSFLGQPIRVSQMVTYDIATRKTRSVGGVGQASAAIPRLCRSRGKIPVDHCAENDLHLSVGVPLRSCDQPNDRNRQPKDRVWSWYADTTGAHPSGIASDGSKWWMYYRRDDHADFSKSIRRTTRDDNNQIDTLAVAAGQRPRLCGRERPRAGGSAYTDTIRGRPAGQLIYENPTGGYH